MGQSSSSQNGNVSPTAQLNTLTNKYQSIKSQSITNQQSHNNYRFLNYFPLLELLQSIPQRNIHYLIHRSNETEYLIHEHYYQSISDYERDLSLIENKRAHYRQCAHIVPIQRYHTECIESGWCNGSNVWGVYVLWVYPCRTLDDEIAERAVRNIPFTREQLWTISASIIIGMSFMEQQLIYKHGALSSRTILISRNGVIQICDPQATNTITNYQIVARNKQRVEMEGNGGATANEVNNATIDGNNEIPLILKNSPHIYLQPQQYQSLFPRPAKNRTKFNNDQNGHNNQNNIKKGPINQPYNSIYTLGIILIQSCLLHYQADLYTPYGTINNTLLISRLNYIRDNYGIQLYQLISMTLNGSTRWSELVKLVEKDFGQRESQSMDQQDYQQGQQQNQSGQEYYHPNTPSYPHQKSGQTTDQSSHSSQYDNNRRSSSQMFIPNKPQYYHNATQLPPQPHRTQLKYSKNMSNNIMTPLFKDIVGGRERANTDFIISKQPYRNQNTYQNSIIHNKGYNNNNYDNNALSYNNAYFTNNQPNINNHKFKLLNPQNAQLPDYYNGQPNIGFINSIPNIPLDKEPNYYNNPQRFN